MLNNNARLQYGLNPTERNMASEMICRLCEAQPWSGGGQQRAIRFLWLISQPLNAAYWRWRGGTKAGRHDR